MKSTFIYVLKPSVSFLQRSDSCIGPTGLGKSTLINTIFASHLIDSKDRFVADEPVRQTTEIQAVSHSEFNSSLTFRYSFFFLVVENGVKLRMNIQGGKLHCTGPHVLLNGYNVAIEDSSVDSHRTLTNRPRIHCIHNTCDRIYRTGPDTVLAI